ncbi:MAG: homoserine dehydrogenase [Clostridia bacterium]|nr:homoserine dehydrogenase [Clostridia bacterium]
MKKINIGIIGLGTVGSGVVALLHQNSEMISRRTNCELTIKSILVNDITRKREHINEKYLPLITDKESVLFDDIQILVEVMGTIDKARYYIEKALKKGIHVVTANKDLMAKYGGELLNLAEKYKVSLSFEASVCGGIPIIDMIKTSFQGNRISSILGILNGTTNYILTLMEEKNVPFKSALKQAQKLGYAESNPANDIEGVDAARKIAILASMAFNTKVPIEKVHVEGITKVDIQDILYAKDLGYRIKLLGMAKEKDGFLKVQVNPVFIPLSHPLANINDVYNGVYLEGDFFGPSMVYGLGAGSFPTASSIVGDIIAASKAIDNKTYSWCTCFRDLKIRDVMETHSNFYIRMTVNDKPGVLASISSILGSHDVSIYSVVQKKSHEGHAELVIITHKVQEASMYDSITVLSSLSVINKIESIIRVEDEEQ